MTIRRFAFPLLFAACGLLFAACGGDDGTGEGSGGLPECAATTTETYDSFGKQFFADYCNSCHSAGTGVKGAETRPYETQAQIQADAEAIFEQSGGTNTAMPQGTKKPTDAERVQLANWLACGAK